MAERHELKALPFDEGGLGGGEAAARCRRSWRARPRDLPKLHRCRSVGRDSLRFVGTGSSPPPAATKHHVGRHRVRRSGGLRDKQNPQCSARAAPDSGTDALRFVVIAASATALSRLGSSPGAGLARACAADWVFFHFAAPRTGALTPTQPSPIEGEGFERRRCAARILGHHDAKTRIPHAIISATTH